MIPGVIPAFVTVIILLCFCALSIKVFLCLFVYSDAKEHTDMPALWVIIVLFIPNFIGVLLYFLLGRKRVVICPGCSARMPQSSRFCQVCGHDLCTAAVASGFSASAKNYLIALFVSLGLLLLSVVGIIFISLTGLFI